MVDIVDAISGLHLSHIGQERLGFLGRSSESHMTDIVGSVLNNFLDRVKYSLRVTRSIFKDLEEAHLALCTEYSSKKKQDRVEVEW